MAWQCEEHRLQSWFALRICPFGRFLKKFLSGSHVEDNSSIPLYARPLLHFQEVLSLVLRVDVMLRQELPLWRQGEVS